MNSFFKYLKKYKATSMNIFILLLVFISFAQAAFAAADLLVNKHSDYKTKSMKENTVTNKHIQARKIDIMKKIISTVLDREDNHNILLTLQGDLEKYIVISAKAREATIYLDSVSNAGKECDIRAAPLNSNLKTDFAIKLKVIINELYERMYIEFRAEDEFFRYEMINNLELLKEMDLKYYLNFKLSIIALLIDFLHVYSLKISGLTDEGTTNKIKEIIIRIKQNDEEFRQMKSRSSKSLLILNNIIQKMPNLGLLMMNVAIAYTSKKIINNNSLGCHETVINPKELIARNRPRLLFININAPINMLSLYENLKNLKKKWKSGKYTEFECKFIFSLYLVEFSYHYCNVIKQFVTAPEYTMDLSNMQSIDNCRLFSLIISLVPGNLINLFKKWNSFRNNRSHYLLMNYRHLQEIIKFREHLINMNMDTSFNVLSDLDPEVVFKSIKVVIGYYQAYLGYQYKECKKITAKVFYDLEAFNDICKIISHHLENIDVILFRNDIEKYVKLCYTLKRLTSINIECSMKNASKSLYDYPVLLEFYEEYCKIGLYIGCIYNINFLLGRSAKGDVLRLYSGYSCNGNANEYFEAAMAFIEHLGKTYYKTLSYEEDIYDTLQNIMNCLIGIKNGTIRLFI